MEQVTDFWFTRLLLQRGLAVVYLIAFLIAALQFVPLLGEKGLLPMTQFVQKIRFWEAPSLFWFFPKDVVVTVCAWLGVGLAAIALTGVSERFGNGVSMAVWFGLWLLYLSFVNVGQTFYAFGWESLLLEAGFLAIFLGAANTPSSVIVIWLFRWLLFRLMLGAGLIKLRGDPCWQDLTCLLYHYQTQPMPNPLSWYFHWLPAWIHKLGVVFNHFVELIVPFGYFFKSPIAAIAGIFTIGFHLLLIVSGNFSFLSLITIVLSFSTLNDSLITSILPFAVPVVAAPSSLYLGATIGLAVAIGALSLFPIINLISPRQAMNRSFNPLHLVNTYGAFGSITKIRNEIIIEGTSDATITSATTWQAYEFKGKPGDVQRLSPQIAPYHLRLDWLMWFAAMDSYHYHPWFSRLLEKLLVGDQATLALLKTNPFADAPPHYVRARLYRYRFTTPAEHAATGAWWHRDFVSEYFPAVSL